MTFSSQRQFMAIPLGILLIASSLAGARAGEPRIFEGYEEFYSSLPRPVFQATDVKPLHTEWVGDSGDPGTDEHASWTGRDAKGGPLRRIKIVGTNVTIGDQAMSGSDARVFEDAAPAALGGRARLYVAGTYVCIEGVSPSASGTAGRHVHVTLITEAFSGHAQRYTLPTLFGSCLNIRHARGERLVFFKAAYDWSTGQDTPVGVIFSEHSLEGDRFQKSEGDLRAVFVEPDNVWRFTVTAASERR